MGTASKSNASAIGSKCNRCGSGRHAWRAVVRRAKKLKGFWGSLMGAVIYVLLHLQARALACPPEFICNPPAPPKPGGSACTLREEAMENYNNYSNKKYNL
jgi:hypothetical protein